VSLRSDFARKMSPPGWLFAVIPVFICELAGVGMSHAAIVNGDPLEVAIAAPNDSVNFLDNSFLLLPPRACS